jgi:hypothetical protein
LSAGRSVYLVRGAGVNLLKNTKKEPPPVLSLGVTLLIGRNSCKPSRVPRGYTYQHKKATPLKFQRIDGPPVEFSLSFSRAGP